MSGGQQLERSVLEAKEREGASKFYMKVLRFYLGRMADAFHCQLRSVTTSQLADFLRNNGESLAIFTGARGFDGCIQRKQMRLLRNGCNVQNRMIDSKRAITESLNQA